MKNILLAITMLMASISTFAQTNKSTVKLPIDDNTKLISYNKVIDVTNQSKDSLFNRVLLWAKSYYKNPYDVIREQRIEEGKIICKARYKISNPPDKKGFASDAGLVQYTLKFICTDQKISLQITDINWKQTSYYACEKWMDTSNQYYKTEFEYYLQQVDANTKEIIKNISKEIR